MPYEDSCRRLRQASVKPSLHYFHRHQVHDDHGHKYRARVNRLYEDESGSKAKDFGFIIDYVGVLGELNQALSTYSALEGFEAADLEGALTSIHEETKALPQRHAELWDLFKTMKNRQD